ncbi:formate dehydrogenase accessory sulfurtransferase FdhD [Xenophilus arseniciresistens]|uniref:Sulfur carrier protein FdhD n=1 Tax=Xenophilus arseniciresistens TaxID=1283306 RepID=A0AAE3T0S9_9BURK|nr:formate dehydrogenase accessory sulfurtransferase FdhD [Xenophilus arseniciresistens]MDA7416617.1 formate dehydrogenase accessory sulfurtransferase FdhD [Xenophilus arseniciresistens]
MSSEPIHSSAAEFDIPPLAQLGVQVFGEPGLPPQGQLREDTLAAEVPVALVFNGLSHAVMMATPQGVEDFALGFALSEGILDSATDCRGIEATALAAADAGLPEGMPGIEVQIEISTRAFERLKGRRRSLAGRTGCGVCGVESFAALDLSPPRVPAHPWAAQIDLPVVLQAIEGLRAQQALNARAGALHAAGWAGLDGALSDVLEDVGRHNALDKLLGRLARTGRLGQPGFVVMTSRGSHELVRKCTQLGVPALATVSAPTAMGVQMARLCGIALWGLCRPPRAVRYTAG